MWIEGEWFWEPPAWAVELEELRRQNDALRVRVEELEDALEADRQRIADLESALDDAAYGLFI